MALIDTIPPIKRLFRKDHGIVVPEITPGCEWVRDTAEGMLSTKLDGICVKVDLDTDLQPAVWKISKKMGPTGWMRVSKEDNPAYFEAFENQEYKSAGIFEVYGKDFNGDPHRIGKNLMVKIFPVDFTLIVQKQNTKIRRGAGTLTTELFETIKQELNESPEIEGLVWHLEDNGIYGVKVKECVKIERKDFGFSWPVESVTIPFNTIP